MSMTFDYGNQKQRLFLPFLSGFYDSIAQPVAWVGLRVATGGMLAVADWLSFLWTGTAALGRMDLNCAATGRKAQARKSASICRAPWTIRLTSTELFLTRYRIR